MATARCGRHGYRLPLMHPAPKEYKDSVAAEMRIYRGCVNVHGLPDIFHYWSNQHILPSLKAFGLSSPNNLFARELERQFSADGRDTRRQFVSLGSGNCDLEVDIAVQLHARGHAEFNFECLDLNADMLERGRQAAVRAGVKENFAFRQTDLNTWQPTSEYHAVIANQSLHHVLELEHLSTSVKGALLPRGVFAVSDMIGRNGHLRWPEAMEVVQEFWRRLPPSYRMNRASGCYEELFRDQDCSGEGFEGVRSQDILPVLLEQFHFQFFFPFGNAIDPFVDRSFGPNFDAAKAWDRAFIDQVHERDCVELASGRLKPTHMMAVMGRGQSEDTIFPGELSPERCVRPSNKPHGRAILFPSPAYQWDASAHSVRDELDKACRMLTDSARLIRQKTDWAHELEAEVAERIEWGEAIEKQFVERTEWALRLDAELHAKNEWLLSLKGEAEEANSVSALLTQQADRLQVEIAERTAWALKLERELEERTAWAVTLRDELQNQTRRADRAEDEVREYVRNPLKLVACLWRRVAKRMGRIGSR